MGIVPQTDEGSNRFSGGLTPRRSLSAGRDLPTRGFLPTIFSSVPHSPRSRTRVYPRPLRTDGYRFREDDP
jgi:hypothetical protein